MLWVEGGGGVWGVQGWWKPRDSGLADLLAGEESGPWVSCAASVAAVAPLKGPEAMH